MQRIRPMVVVLVALSLTGVVYAGGGAKKMTEETASTETATSSTPATR